MHAVCRVVRAAINSAWLSASGSEGRRSAKALLLVVFLAATGCMSPYAADRGALLGGATGAGAGALVGAATGHTLAGTLIGGGLGAVTGGAIGQGFDDLEAKNRAMIESQLGQQLQPGAVTIDDVISMSKSGVNEDLIATHVRNNGMVAPLTAQDLVTLQQQGVSQRVVAAMQAPPPQMQRVATVPAPVYVDPYYYPPPPPPYWGPYWGPPCYRPCRPRTGVSWGVSVAN